MSYAVPIAVTPDGDSDVSRYYDQPFVVEDDGLMSCYDHNGDLSSVDAFACRNSSFQSGTFLFDPGCQTMLMKSRFNRFMKSVKSSNLRVSGFDNSTQVADKQGEAAMYFMQD